MFSSAEIKTKIDKENWIIDQLKDEYVYLQIQYNNLMYMITERSIAKKRMKNTGSLAILDQYDKLYREIKLCKEEKDIYGKKMKEIEFSIGKREISLKALKKTLKTLEERERKCGIVVNMKKKSQKKN